VTNDTTPTIRVFIDNRVVNTIGGTGTGRVTEEGDTVELRLENLTSGDTTLLAPVALSAANITNGFVDITVPAPGGGDATASDGEVRVSVILTDQSVDVSGAANPNFTDTDNVNELAFVLDTVVDPVVEVVPPGRNPTAPAGRSIVLVDDSTGGPNTNGSPTDEVTNVDDPRFDTDLPATTGNVGAIVGPLAAHFAGSNQEALELVVDGTDVLIEDFPGGPLPAVPFLILDDTNVGSNVEMDMTAISLLGADGAHNIQVRTTDVAGNSVITVARVVTLDTVTSGTINVAGIANGILGTATGGETDPLVINGTAEVGSEVVVQIENLTTPDIVTLPAFGAVTAAGTWGLTDPSGLGGLAFADGDQVRFTLTVTDAQDNVFTTNTAASTIDTGATTAPGLAALDAALADGTEDDEEELLALLAAGA